MSAETFRASERAADVRAVLGFGQRRFSRLNLLLRRRVCQPTETRPGEVEERMI